MKIAKYVLSGAAFLLATGAAFSTHIKDVGNMLTVVRYEESPGGTPCTLVTRQCSMSGTDLCAIEGGTLYELKTCSSNVEQNFIFKPQM